MRTITILLMIIAVLTAWSVAHPTPVPSGITQWEYAVAVIPDEQLIEKMNVAGRNGWELVFAQASPSSHRMTPRLAIKKRVTS